jgi:hypothetical protein
MAADETSAHPIRETVADALENDRCGRCGSVEHFVEDCPVQPDVAPGPDVDAGGAGDEVYLAAARLVIARGRGRSYWWDQGAYDASSPESRAAYIAEGIDFRAAIDAARAPLLAELADATRLLETSHEVRTALAADLAQAILERDVSRAIADKLVAKMDGGRWLTQMGRDTPTGIEWCRAADDRYGCGPDRQTHEWNHDVRRLRWIGPVEPVTDDGSST